MQFSSEGASRGRFYNGRASRGRVVLAEDDDAMRTLLASRVRRDGFEVLEARDGGELWALMEAAQEARSMVPRSIDTHTHSEAFRLGAQAVFDKPFDVDDLCTAVVNLVPAA